MGLAKYLAGKRLDASLVRTKWIWKYWKIDSVSQRINVLYLYTYVRTYATYWRRMMCLYHNKNAKKENIVSDCVYF